jgi:ectoine hydroxylase-related dioxygenase (phytanoyl-CoA dioxygenase family)
MEAGADTKLTSAEQRAQFQRDGYFIIEDLGLPPEVFDDAAADFVPLLLEEEHAEVWGDDGVFYTSHRIMDAWKISENVKAIATAPRILGILEELYGRKPLPFQTLNFKMPTQQRAHSDTIHFNSKPGGFMAGVWVALEDMDMDNGPLFYHPGSQKLPEVTMQDVGVEADYSQYLHYEEYMQSVVKDLTIEYADSMKKGQALIWSANLLHGGSPAKDPNRTRKSQVTHFFFEGTRYYTPLTSKDLSTEEGIFWREPEWIPTDAS